MEARRDALRKVYQRAISTPMHNLEAIWRDYSAFETQWDKTLWQGLMAQHSKNYMGARQICRERKTYWEGINRAFLAVPPSGSSKEETQVGLWKRLIRYEKGNPEQIEPDELTKRVSYTYDQALLCLYRFPDIWHDLAAYLLEREDEEGAIKVYERAIVALPKNLLIHFSFADMLEGQQQLERCEEIYENLMESHPSPLVFIQYMRFARRAFDASKSRAIFHRAMKSDACSHHVYAVAADMEYFVNKDGEIGRKIFQLGMRKYGSQPSFLLRYLQFMGHLNEEEEVRALYEKMLEGVEKEESEGIWKSYLAFEYLHGSLDTIKAVEKRKKEIFPNEDPRGIATLVSRYRFEDLWPVTPVEFRSFSIGEKKDKGKE